MKNKSLLLFPVAVLALGVAIGCNANNTDTQTTSFDQEIDDALSIPDNLKSCSNYESIVLRNSLIEGLKSLVGVNSKVTDISSYAQVYTGSYKKFVNDYETRYSVSTHHYNNQVFKIETNKSEKQTVSGVTTETKASRIDTIVAPTETTPGYDNIDYTYERIGSQKIQLSRSLNYPYEILENSDKAKMGNDGDSTDLQYFWKENEQSFYCIKDTKVSEQVVNPLSPSVSITQTSVGRVIMHFVKGSEHFYPKTYAYSKNIYYDRDLAGTIFTSPVLVSSYKYVNEGVYGMSTSYSGEIEQNENLVSSMYMNRYMPKSDTADDPVKDTNYANNYLSNVSYIDHALNPESTDYVYTFSASYKSKTDLRKEAESALPGRYNKDMYDPTYLIELLYSDDYIIYDYFDRTSSTIYLSKNHLYDFSLSFDNEEPIPCGEGKIVEDKSYFTFENGKLRVNKSGEYLVTARVSKDKEDIKIYVEQILDTTYGDVNNYYNVNVKSLDKSTVTAKFIYPNEKEKVEVTMEEGKNYNMLSSFSNIVLTKSDDLVIPFKNILIEKENLLGEMINDTINHAYFENGLLSQNYIYGLFNDSSRIVKYDLTIKGAVAKGNICNVNTQDKDHNILMDNINNTSFVYTYSVSDTPTFNIKYYYDDQWVTPETVKLTVDGIQRGSEITVDKETSTFQISAGLLKAGETATVIIVK